MDPIADMLVIIKNGYLANKEQVVLPYSKFKLQIAKVLEKEGRVEKTQKEGKGLELVLKYDKTKPAINEIKRVSKLGRRVYIKSKHIKSIKGGRGFSIISTPNGVMTDKDARKKNLGGEVICQIW